jgi:hypothetical protein
MNRVRCVPGLLGIFLLMSAPAANASQVIMDGISQQTSTGNCYALSTMYGFGFIPGDTKHIGQIDLYVTAALGSGSVRATIYQNASNGWSGGTLLGTFTQPSPATSYTNGSISGYVVNLVGNVSVVNGLQYWVYFSDPNISTDGNTEMDCLDSTAPTLSGTWAMVTSSGSYILTNSTGAPFSYGAYPAFRIYVPTPATISVAMNSGGSVTNYRASTQIKATVNSDGPVSFFDNGKAIPGCKKISSSSGTALCNWKPSVQGPNLLSASVTPIDSGNYSANTSSIFAVSAVPRTTKR